MNVKFIAKIYQKTYFYAKQKQVHQMTIYGQLLLLKQKYKAIPSTSSD